MNEVISIAAGLLQVLAVAPASSSFLNPHIDSILLAISTFITRGEEGLTDFTDFANQLTAMVTADKDPTDQDFAELKEKSDAAHNILESIQGSG